MSICAYCEKDAELRPYGRKGASIFFECAMKDADESYAKAIRAMQPPAEWGE